MRVIQNNIKRQLNPLYFFIIGLFIACQNNTPSESHSVISNNSKSVEPQQDANDKSNQSPGQKNMFLPENRILHDMNFDSIPDTVFIIAPELTNNEDGLEDNCNGPCVTILHFSSGFPELVINESIGGEVVFLEDINENGYTELVFFPYWFHSCWSRMDVFSFNGSSWRMIQSLSYNACDDSYPTEFEKLETGILRVITNGEKVEELYTPHGDTILDFQGIERKVYDLLIQ